jgi:PAS domain S-box-containing protein
LDRRLFRPTALLRQGAQRIGAGRLDHRIAAVGNNEIGQVATAFNEMAAHLHARQKQLVAQTAALNEEVLQRRQAQMALQRARDELEAKVTERTQQLRTTNQQLQEELKQHRQSQEALATVESRLRHLLLTSPAIIFSIRFDGETRVSYISDNIRDATGYSPEDYYADARFAYQYIHPDDVARIDEQMRRLAEVERVSYDYRFRVRSGEYRWFHDDAVAVYDEQGKVREVVGSLIDIDERKRLEEEQAAIRDQALEASRLKSEFLATVSHEIRTPLNGVIGMADLLLSTPLNAEQSDYVKTIAYSADSLLIVINDVLDLSKVEAGKLAMLQSEFSPAQVVQGVAGLLSPRAKEKGIALRVKLATNLPARICGYEARLRQVLLNLVGNAVKFTEQGEVVITVAPVKRDHAAESRNNSVPLPYWVRFTVSDTGIGLDTANYSKLFQPFSQVDSSLARRYGGAGLGLAISKRLVELMGGEIGVESEVGKGSDFWITVPLQLVEEDETDGAGGKTSDTVAAAQQEKQVTMSHQEGSAWRPKYLPEVASHNGYHPMTDPAQSAQPQILLVEDNQVNQKVAIAQLKRMGYTVEAVLNGREAVEAVERQVYAVILMDCQMPEVDGFEATRMIRALEDGRGRSVPIIAMTANAMNGDREACLEAGMNDYLAKPIRPHELQAILQKWLEAPG